MKNLLSNLAKLILNRNQDGLDEKHHLMTSTANSSADINKAPKFGIISARYIFAILGCFGFVNMFAMRVNLSVAIVAMVNSSAIRITSNESLECVETANSSTGLPTQLGGEFLWDEKTQGIILSSFSWLYIVTQIPGGRLAEKFSGKWLYGSGVFITAIFTLLTPVAAEMGVWYIVAARVLEGFGQGVTLPAMHAMLVRWTPVNETSRLVTIILSGPLIGSMLGMILSAYLCVHGFAGGWPSVFYVFGLLGIIWCCFWAVFAYDSPEKHPWINLDERKYILQSRRFNNTSPPIPWKKILTSFPVWSIIICHFCQAWGFCTLLTELPTYFETILHFDMNKNGLFSALPYLFSLIFGFYCSVACDKLICKQYFTTKFARKFFNSIGLIVPGVLLAFVTSAGCDQSLSYSILIIAVTTNGATICGLLCNHIDIAPNFAGTLMGLTNSAASISGAVAPYIAGEIIQGKPYRSQWAIVFYITSAISIFGALIFNFFGDAEIQDWNQADDKKITTNEKEIN